MNQRIGYARVSTDDQHLDLQCGVLTKAGCSVIYAEKVSGKTAGRPELDQCLKVLRAGDTLVVWRLDRLGRSLQDLLRIVDDLKERGIGFVSLTEKIETDNAAGKLIFHVFAALSEFERSLIRERTHAGLAAARARGRAGGRKPKLDAKQINQIRLLLSDPDTCVAELARDYGVSRTTLYKHCGVVQPRHEGNPSKRGGL
ncbi:recombinase family protein [Achromobacter sp. PAB15]|uniref:recombinase family protein n=1 Tax=Achromobacter sp. PAB15 TaxID=3233048 RepID=UPI003F93C793